MADRRAPKALLPALLPALLLAFLLGGCGGSADGRPGDGVVTDVSGGDDDGMYGAVLTTPYELPDAVLTDTSGKPFHVSSALDAPLTLVFFGYSNCPDICQAVMSDLASAKARLDDSEAGQVHVWFVTTDPARDTPTALRAYVDRFDPDFEGLTGPLEEIVRVADAVHVPIERGPKLPTGGYEVTHGTPVLGVRSDGSVPILWTEGTSAAKLAADIHRILSEDR